MLTLLGDKLMEKVKTDVLRETLARIKEPLGCYLDTFARKLNPHLLNYVNNYNYISFNPHARSRLPRMLVLDTQLRRKKNSGNSTIYIPWTCPEFIGIPGPPAFSLKDVRLYAELGLVHLPKTAERPGSHAFALEFRRRTPGFSAMVGKIRIVPASGESVEALATLGWFCQKTERQQKHNEAELRRLLSNYLALTL